MIEDSIFPILSLDRSLVRWSDYLDVLTPVEHIEGLWFKRDDKFAPLGYGGINGSKLRQCIYLINNYVNKTEQPIGLLSGASVKSPQLAACSVVGRHYGLSSTLVIGATNPKSAMKHENVAIAAAMGAKFLILKVGYNPVLQSKVRSMMKEPAYQDFYHLEYGISISSEQHTAEEIEAFHRLGAQQVANMPPEVTTLIIPAGSCNTAVSILYGIALHTPENLLDVYLIGVGPEKLDFIDHRLSLIESVTGKPIRSLFLRNYVHHLEKGEEQNRNSRISYPYYYLHHYDLHATKYTSYGDEMKWTHGGLAFHPTYEGKVMRYVSENLPQLLNPKTCIWVVGSKPTMKAMLNRIPEFNYVPEEVSVL